MVEVTTARRLQEKRTAEPLIVVAGVAAKGRKRLCQLYQVTPAPGY